MGLDGKMFNHPERGRLWRKGGAVQGKCEGKVDVRVRMARQDSGRLGARNDWNFWTCNTCSVCPDYVSHSPQQDTVIRGISSLSFPVSIFAFVFVLFCLLGLF